MHSQLFGVRHDDAIWSRDAYFITNGGIGERQSDGRRQVKSEKAQGGGEANHFHDLKE